MQHTLVCLDKLEHIRATQTAPLLILHEVESSKSCWSTGEVLVTGLKTQTLYHIKLFIRNFSCNHTSQTDGIILTTCCWNKKNIRFWSVFKNTGTMQVHIILHAPSEPDLLFTIANIDKGHLFKIALMHLPLWGLIQCPTHIIPDILVTHHK